MISPENIPAELRNYHQWICWNYEDNGKDKPTKVPYSPVTKSHAKVNDPHTWVSFDVAMKHAGEFSGIGFVLTQNDPFVFIDLDDTDGDVPAHTRQQRIYSEFNSYTEYSPSGKGVHILVKGSVPSGRKRSKIEVYSDVRFMTVTGNVLNDKPIEIRHDLVNMLWSQMGGVSTNIVDGESPQTENDDDVIKRALSATNGDKFNDLLSGNWQQLYASQSEADFAFIDIIAFYSQNREQLTRLFRASPLGQRDKAKRADYVNWMINKSFDNILPPIDFEGLKLQLEEAIAFEKARQPEPVTVESVPVSPIYKSDTMYRFPPGMLGYAAQYILAQAPRPVQEVALTAAIALMAGIVGKAYNVSRTGLNQYTLLLGNTGIGKEAGPSGIHKIIDAVKSLAEGGGNVPAAGDFIGPGEVASPQALIKFIANKSQCFVSIVGEYGLQLRQMSNNDNPNSVGLRRALLHLYNKSGKGDQLSEMIYSDKSNSTSMVESPAFSLYGESTPETFYGTMDESSITDGLLPRFTVIEYNGPRPPLVDTSAILPPPRSLIEQFAALTANCLTMQHNRKVVNVTFSPEAQRFCDAYNTRCDAQMNGAEKEVVRHLWNRAHLRMIKLAALVAVGINQFEPVIDIDCAKWAEPIITSNVIRLLSRFEAGEVGADLARANGNHETVQMSDVVRVIKEFHFSPDAIAGKYKIDDRMVTDKIMPYSFFQRRLTGASSYKHDRQGPTLAIKRTIQSLLDSDLLREVGKADMATRYGTKQRGFIVSAPSLLA